MEDIIQVCMIVVYGQMDERKREVDLGTVVWHAR